MIRQLGCGVFTLALSILLILGVVLPSTVHALTLETEPANPSVEGKSLEARLRVSSSGMKQDPSYPLETVVGEVGQTFDMGTLESIPEKRVSLEVKLPWGKYYRGVSRDELSQGTITLTVYPTGDNSELEISRHGILLQPFPKRLMVREYIVFRNNGKTMAGGPDNPVTFDLPEGMDRLIPGPGLGSSDEMSADGGKYRYQNLVPPGESMVGFFYMIRPESNRFTFRRSPSLPTQRFAVRVPSFEKLNITTDGLQKSKRSGNSRAGPGGHTATIYSTENLMPDESIRLTFEGLNEISAPGSMQGGQGESPSDRGGGMTDRPSSFSNVSWPLILGIGFSVAIFVASYGYVQYKLSQGSPAGVGEDFLVREIATLDQEYDDGAIDEAFYKRTRRRWKQKAEELSDNESS